MTTNAKSFSIFSDGLLPRIAKVDNTVQADGERNSPTSARRESSPPHQQVQSIKISNARRPISANHKPRGPSIKMSNAKRNSRSPTAKSRGAADAFLADLSTFDREELISTVLTLKKEQNISETTISMLRADNQRFVW